VHHPGWPRRTLSAVLLAALLTLLAGSVIGGSALFSAAPAGAAGHGVGAHRRRVLLLTLPATTWQDLKGRHLPNLERLFATSAMGDLATRTANGPANPNDGYATIGAGTRAASSSTTADTSYDVAEPFGTATAGDAFSVRTGRAVTRGIVYLGLSSLDSENASKLYGAEIGAFGDTLARAGVHRAVIGNADAPTPNPAAVPQTARDVALGLMDSRGVVSRGEVTPTLLRNDARAPYGKRLDTTRVVTAFTSAWRDDSVVLVEASDLTRADMYGQYTVGDQRTHLRDQALQWTDALVGRLLAHVNLAQDIVMVVSPSHPSGPSSLGMVALHTPTTRAGLLRSPTMRRNGFSALVDVAPTILQRLGIDRPDAMEGRPMVETGDPAPYRERLDRLAQADVDGRFRDSLVDGMQTTVMVIGCLLAAGAVFLVVVGRLRRAIGILAVFALALPTATYLAAPFHFASHGGTGAFRAFVVVVTLLLGSLCLGLGRWTRASAVESALGLIVVLHLVDAVSGTHLEFNTPLGYSATVGIRVAGLGNPTFAQLAAAALLLAGLFVARGSRHGRTFAVGLLALTFVVLAAPFFGQSFGAALATAPAFALFAWLVAGRAVRVRHVVMLAGIIVLSGLVVGAVDLLRPGSNQTHIGVFFQQVGGRGSSDFFTVIHRKLDENFASFSVRSWVVLTLVGIGTLAWLIDRGHLRDRLAWPADAWRATTWSMGVLLVLGYAFKDSGIAVPAVMLFVLLAGVTGLLAGRGPDLAPAVGPDDEPAERGARPSVVPDRASSGAPA
jgi:hypothetical protein